MKYSYEDMLDLDPDAQIDPQSMSYVRHDLSSTGFNFPWLQIGVSIILVGILVSCQSLAIKSYEHQREATKIDRDLKEQRFIELHTRARAFCQKEFTDLMQVEWCVTRYIDKND